MSVRIIVGDAREKLKEIPSASIQACVTSPPYFNLRDYQIAGQIGLEPSPDEYVAEMVGVFREVRRVLADTGCVFLNLGDSYAGSWGARGRGEDTNAARPDLEAKYGTDAPARRGYASLGIKPKDLLGIPWAVAFALRADGWWLRSAITWCKGNAMPESVVDRPTSATEMVFLFTKASRYFYDSVAIAEPAEESSLSRLAQNVEDQAGSLRANGGAKTNGPMRAVGGATRNARNWWVINSQPFAGSHFAVMPSALAERCVRAGTSERGQCPYCGSPWARVGERTAALVKAPASNYGHGADRNDGGRSQLVGAGFTTTGWQPTCTCSEHLPIPQTVLDPFAGAGTTLLVASRLGRSSIGIELNPSYAELAQRRVYDDCPMFSGLEVVA